MKRLLRALTIAGFASLVGLDAAQALPNCKVGDTSPACRCGGKPCTPPPPTVVYGTHSYTPAYVLLSILYDPPGAASSVSFSDGNNEGSTTGISSSFGNGLSIAASTSGGLIGEGTVGATFSQSNSTANASTFSITSSSAQGSQVSSTKDGIDHSQDRFFIWLNPLITVKQTGPNTAVYGVGTVNGNPMDIIDVSLAELQNPSSIPASKMGTQVIRGVSLPGLSVLQASDFASLAAMDTLSAVNFAPTDTTRYVYVNSLPLEGPDAKGTNAVKSTFNEADGSATAHTQTETSNMTASLQTGGKVDIPGVFTFESDRHQLHDLDDVQQFREVVGDHEPDDRDPGDQPARLLGVCRRLFRHHVPHDGLRDRQPHLRAAAAAARHPDRAGGRAGAQRNPGRRGRPAAAAPACHHHAPGRRRPHPDHR